MRAMVVYESMFGNTQRIATAIADGLATSLGVQVVEVGTADGPPGEDVDLLVVGGPTHAFGLSRAATRQSAAEQAGGPVVSANGGIREWLDVLPKARPGRRAVAFDTRIDKRWIPGAACRGAAKRLRAAGYRLAAPPESFYVTDSPGPLRDGELDRARWWGQRVGETLAG